MRGISMRWWLPLAFAMIAAGTAAVVGFTLDLRAESAFRSRAHAIAVGDSVAAATAIPRPGTGATSLDSVATARNLDLYVVSTSGTLVQSSSGAPSYATVPHRDDAVQAVDRNQRYVLATPHDGTVVGLRLASQGRVLVAYRPQSGTADDVATLRHEVLFSSVLAGTGGVVVGVLLAALITRRVRRISQTAIAIEGGDFSRKLNPGFGDEIGSLGASIDRMRGRLATSFEALALERDRLSLVLERLHEGVVTIDLDGFVDFVNPAAQRLLPRATLFAGAALPEPWPNLDLQRFVDQVRGSGGSLERNANTSDGRIFDIFGLPPTVPDGTVVLVFNDVSQRESQQRAEREFIANAAHELRTPTAAILTSVEVLQQGAKDDPHEREKFLAHIAREAGRLSRLSTAMLVLARARTGAEPLELSAVPLAPLLTESINSIRTESRFDVSCPNDLSIKANPDLAYQLFVNLVSNASRHGRGRPVQIDASASSGRVRVAISDRGPGIPPEETGRVFDRFYRIGNARDNGGFGLGLAIVRDVTEALGGTVKVDSNGDGTRVIVTLPQWDRRP
jgi:signal transduction histidine kinase